MIGQVLGHYRITHPIERGGMATVYRATDIHLQREVAIKIFQIANDEITTKSFFQRFLREAQVVASLDHPNILLVHDYGEENGLAYLVMPYLAQGSLKQMLQRRRVVPVLEALDLLIPVLDALQYAHDQRLIHRDIKPGNILFKTERTLVLADFGLVKEILVNDETWHEGGAATKQSSLSNGLIVGTPQYMAPEQIRGNPVPMSDIYSIGIVLYEMLTGRHPFIIDSTAELPGILIKQLYQQPPSPRAINPAIPPQLEAIMLRALEKDIHRRYQRPGDFLHALQESKEQLSRNIPPTPDNRTLNSHTLFTPRSDILTKEDQITTVSIPSTIPVSMANTSSFPISPSPTRQAFSHPIQRSGRHLVFKILLAIFIVTLVLGSLWLVKPEPFAGLLQQTKLPQQTNLNNSNNQLHTTAPLPPMKTDCPADGKARAAVTSPLVSQGHNTVVYIANDARGRLLAYDAVTGKTSTITTIPRPIVNAQLFGDGQWILFVSQRPEPVTERAWIQLIRLDGQGLQTLYCSAPAISITDALLSPATDMNKARLIFNEKDDPTKTSMYMLTLNKGELQRKLFSQQAYTPITWLINDDILLTTKTPGQQGDLYHLNIGQDTQVQNSTFPLIAPGGLCHDFSVSPDNKVVFISHCKGLVGSDCAWCQPSEGPSDISGMNISLEGAFGGPHSIFKSDTLALTQIRAITATTLLFLVENTDGYARENGLWKLNSESQEKQRLISETTDPIFLNSYSQYPWSNISLDGTMYALRTASRQSLGSDTLLIGPLDGGPPKIIDHSGKNGTQLEVVGWTM